MGKSTKAAFKKLFLNSSCGIPPRPKRLINKVFFLQACGLPGKMILYKLAGTGFRVAAHQVQQRKNNDHK
jgi:hypothetical protein